MAIPKGRASEMQEIMQVVTWFLVVVGWFYVDKRNNIRDARKELRIIVDGLVSAVVDIRDKAFQFHTGPDPDALLAGRIKFDIQMIGCRIGAITNYGATVNLQLVVDYRKSITLYNFDDHEFVQQLPNSSLIGEIDRCADALTNGLELAFQNTFLGGGCSSFHLCCSQKHNRA